MKILQITPFYLPSKGGIQSYVHYLSQNLQNLGHTVDILTINTEEKIKSENINGIGIYRCDLDLNYHRGLVSFEFIKEIINRKNYDIYHIHIPFPLGLEAAILASKINKIPIIVTHHGEPKKDLMIYSLINNTYSKFYRHLSLRSADKIIFLTKDYSKSLNLNKLIQNRIKIINAGVNTDVFYPRDKNKSKEKIGFSYDDRIILFVGDLSIHNRYKGVDYLIKAFKEVTNEINNLNLVIIGKGELILEYKELCKELNLLDKVFFLGSIGHDDLPDYYAASDIFVLPSISGPENSPIVIIESMAMGKPVIATKIPGVRELVVNGTTGLLVKPKNCNELKNAILKILMNTDLNQSYGKNALKRCLEIHNWKKVSKMISELYSEVIRVK